MYRRLTTVAASIATVMALSAAPALAGHDHLSSRQTDNAIRWQRDKHRSTMRPTVATTGSM